MNLYFEKLRWRNFLSTGNIFTEINFTQHKMSLIVGENGAGKSTMLDALCFVLFNKPFRKINKPQLVNSLTKKECLVEIEFSTRGSKYKIVRGMKPNIFEIWKDGILINQDAKAMDYQAHLEKHILKTNLKTFCQIVILGSASFVPFMQLPAGQRREITEDLLDLQIFTSMNSLLKNHNSARKTLHAQKEHEKDLLSERIEIVRTHTKQLLEEKQKRIDDKNQKLVEFEEEYHTFTTQLREKSDYVDELIGHTKDSGVVDKRMNKLTQLRSQLMGKVANLKNDIKFLLDHDNCPTCNQVIDPEFRDKTQCDKHTHIDEITDGLNKLDVEFEKVQTRATEIANINKQISDTNMEIYVLNSKIDSTRNFMKVTEKELNELLDEQAEATDIESYESLEKELESLIKEKGDIEQDLYMMDYVSVLLKDTGIKSRIIKQYVPIINKLINKYLAALDFFVDFNMNESFEETIKSRGRDDFSYNSFSEGEKMRIDLAVLFAWRAVSKLRSSINTNLLIMDEVFDGSLDATGTEEFMKVLMKLTEDLKENNNVFIISHKTDQLGDKFPKVIEFQKIQNFSRMVE